MVPTAPRSQTAEEIVKKRRSFSPEVLKNPSLLITKKAIASKAPTAEKPPIKLRNLNAVVRRFIG
jgi:hypothetical protein